MIAIFVYLFVGVLASILLLLIENILFKWTQNKIKQKSKENWNTIIKTALMNK